jgi:hypothetical protein
MEELKTDICYASRKPLINFDNDAASCYDRIIAALASLVSRSHGQHRDVCFVHAETLQEAKFRLKTEMGVTEEFYQHCKAYPIYGTGQGSGNSPVIWVFISSVLFQCHAKYAKGAVFESPDKSVTIKFYMVGFVDDSTGQVNDFLSDAEPTIDHLVSLMAHDAQLWNDLLHVSGGLLEVTKCSYHIIYFSFRPNGLPFMQSGLRGPPLNLTSSLTGEPIYVATKSTYETHKTLGHHKSPAGKSTKHLRHLTSTGKTLSLQLALSPATRIQSFLFYWSIYVSKIRFTLPQCFFTPAYLEAAQSKSMPLIFAKCGYMRTTAYSILFGPKFLGGAGFLRWLTLQGEGQILLFIKHWRAYDDAGRLLRVAVAWVQYQSGVGIPIFENPHLHLPYLESRWLPSMRAFLSQINGQLILDKTYVAPLQREQDEYIMSRVLETGVFTDHELHLINCCRLYLNVITVSDVALACGSCLDPTIATHQPSGHSTSNYHRPLQAYPPNWRLWDRVMSIWFDDNHQARVPLGPWLTTGDRLRRTWSAYYDHADSTIYLRTQDGFAQCSETQLGHCLEEASAWRPSSTSFPIHSIPIPDHPTHFRSSCPIPPLRIRPTHPVPESFDQYVMTLPKWEQSLFTSLEFLVPPFHLAATLSNLPRGADTPALQIHFVSDGSQIDETTTFGWVLSLSDGTRLAQCAGPGCGPGTSHRAEGYGVLSAVCFVSRLQLFVSTTAPWSLRFTTDNKGLLIRIGQRQNYDASYANATLAPDWDLVEEIVTQLRRLPVQPLFSHVKGHQDNHFHYADLSLDAQLNVDADKLAGDFMSQYQDPQTIVPLMPTTGVHLNIDSKTITGHYSTRIRTAAATPAIIQFLRKKNSWSTSEWDSINLDIYSSIIRRNVHRHVNVVKFIHDKLPTATIRQYTDSHISTRCILCHEAVEKFSHVIRCLHPSRQIWRQELLTLIRTHCETSTTRLVLLQILTQGLSQWFRGLPLPPHTFPPQFHELIHQQNTIGWFGFLRGFTSKLWVHHQHNHYRHNGLVKTTVTGSLWLVSLLSRIWDHVFVLWDQYKSTLHGATALEQTAILKRTLSLRIRALHDRYDDVRADDRIWFIPNLDYYLEHAKPHTMKNWLATYEPIILDGIRLACTTALANTRSLQSYFPTTQQPRHPRDRASTINPRLHNPIGARLPRRPRIALLPPNPTVLQFFRPLSVPPLPSPPLPPPHPAPPWL